MKHSSINENSFILWHKNLRPISKERIERLVRILENLDFTILYVYIVLKKNKLNTLRKIS